MDIGWYGTNALDSVAFRCGYCGNAVATNQGYFAQRGLSGNNARIYICPHCAKPTFFLGSSYSPRVAPGDDVQHLPDHVSSLYREARNCIAAQAYTASVLACRKLLMNIAVAQGAKEGLRFIEYVEYLANSGYVPPNGRGWVDLIRQKGNEATHEIVLMGADDATKLLSFVEMLLKFIFEFPAHVPSRSEQNT